MNKYLIYSLSYIWSNNSTLISLFNSIYNFFLCFRYGLRNFLLSFWCDTPSQFRFTNNFSINYLFLCLCSSFINSLFCLLYTLCSSLLDLLFARWNYFLNLIGGGRCSCCHAFLDFFISPFQQAHFLNFIINLFHHFFLLYLINFILRHCFW